MGKRLLPRWNAWRTRRRKTRGVPFDYILKDKYHPYVSDPGDSENPGLLLDGTVVMHPVFAKAEDLSGKPDPFGFRNMSDDQIYSMYEGLQEPETVQDLHQWRWYRDNPESEAERLLKIQQNEPLEIVSPEFDLLTLGMAGKDLWKGIKTFRALGKAPMSYTGVPKYKASDFKNFARNIFTSNNKSTANSYASQGTGKIFKIYDIKNGDGIVTIPKAEPIQGKEVVYSWADLPYHITEDGTVMKVSGGEEFMPYRGLKNKQGLYTGGIHTTDDLIEQAKNAGYRGIKFDEIFEGTHLDENLNSISPIIKEIIYDGSVPGLVRAPLNEPLWITALKNSGTNFGGITSFGTGLTRYGIQ